MTSANRIEVDRSCDFFQRHVGEWLGQHAGEYALIKGQTLVAFHRKVAEALADSRRRYGQEPFSIQEVTVEPLDLGVWSHLPSA